MTQNKLNYEESSDSDSIDDFYDSIDDDLVETTQQAPIRLNLMSHSRQDGASTYKPRLVPAIRRQPLNNFITPQTPPGLADIGRLDWTSLL